MAENLTYNSLVIKLQRYCERSDSAFVEEIPNFIMLGQRALALNIKPLELKIVDTGNCIAGDPTIPKDARWLLQESFQIGSADDPQEKTNLYPTSIEYITQYAPSSSLTGKPYYYTTEYNVNVYYLAPTPDSRYNYQSVYYIQPTLLDLENQTNVLTERYPRALELACLKETVPFVRSDDRIQMFNTLYGNETNSILIQQGRRTAKELPHGV